MTPLVAIVVTIGMIFIVPMGLRLIPSASGTPNLRLATVWPYAAVPAAIALWLPRGPVAEAMCAPYGIAAALLAAVAAIRLRRPSAQNIAICTAMVSPLIAASALLAERAGYALFGFKPAILALTVAHFHFAGFSAALIAGLTRRNRWAAVSVPVGIGLVFLGFFLGPELQLAGAAVLTTGMWIVAWSLWHEQATSFRTLALLRTSALVLPLTMLLALDWALGNVFGVPHLSLVWMEATHGVGNALGFALCAILALRELRARHDPAAVAPLPDRLAAISGCS